MSPHEVALVLGPEDAAPERDLVAQRITTSDETIIV
jgi:hypothetical protein